MISRNVKKLQLFLVKQISGFQKKTLVEYPAARHLAKSVLSATRYQSGQNKKLYLDEIESSELLFYLTQRFGTKRERVVLIGWNTLIKGVDMFQTKP